MGISTKDREYMRQAIELAALARGSTSPNPMVGAVVVLNNQIVGKGFHKQAGLPHGEIEALADAGDKTRGAILYVNLEPCCHQGRTPPCTQTIIRSGITRVVAAMVDPDPRVSGRGLKELRESGIEVDCGVLEGDARRLNEAFITFHLQKRPFTVAKWAMSLDGRTSTDTGDSRWISNEDSREYAHELRASVDAIAVGLGTVMSDNPRLNVRLQGYNRKQPARVVFDERIRTPLGARCLDSSGGQAYIVASEQAPEARIQAMRKAGHKILIIPGANRDEITQNALQALAENGIQSLLIEGGRQLHTTFLRLGLIDKVAIFVGSKIIGGEGLSNPLFGLGISRIREAISPKNIKIQTFGTDVCIEGYLNLPPQPVELEF